MPNRPPTVAHQLTENVKLLQKAVLIHQGEVLLLKRDMNDTSRPNCWDTPGGNSEWPESSVDPQNNLHLKDICREIQEEAAITISPDSLTHQNLVYHETYYEPAREVFTVLFGWRILLPVDFDRASVQISHEHQAAEWVTPEKALNYDFGGPKGDFMKKILAAATK
jgi:8-oxo-dGTP pyrophosphatase MutT (NUDIX family)